MTSANGELVIDADGHIVEDIPAILSRMPEPYQAEAQIRKFPLFPPVDHLHSTNLQTMPPGAFANVGPEGWLDFLEDVGIEKTVLYPSEGLRSGKIVNIDWAIDVTRAYNDWLADTYSRWNDRFVGIALLPMQEPGAAVEELRRVVTELGMPGAMLPGVGLKAPLGCREYWPVFAEADRLGCSLAVHGGVHMSIGMDYLTPYAPVHALGHPFALMISLASILFNGMFDKYPNARIGFLEGGVSWFLTCLERFERSYDSHAQYNLRGEFVDLTNERVSEAMLRYVNEGKLFIGCEGGERELAHAVKVVGQEPFMYSSDFPHEVNNETCKSELQDILESEEMSPQERGAVLSGNAKRFYKLA